MNIQSFGNGLFDINDHQVDHPIIANSKKMPNFSLMHS